MERLLKWLDECDDLLVLLRVQGPTLALTAALLATGAAGLGAFLLLGAPELHAAP